jgi:hypothetical protein
MVSTHPHQYHRNETRERKKKDTSQSRKRGEVKEDKVGYKTRYGTQAWAQVQERDDDGRKGLFEGVL